MALRDLRIRISPSCNIFVKNITSRCTTQCCLRPINNSNLSQEQTALSEFFCLCHGFQSALQTSERRSAACYVFDEDVTRRADSNPQVTKRHAVGSPKERFCRGGG